MAYRGRLIVPFKVDLARLDTQLTAYDDTFQTSRVRVIAGQRVETRAEQTLLTVPCQIEPADDETQTQTPGGNAPTSTITLVFHFATLEKMHLLDANGEPTIRVNTRLAALRRKNGTLIRTYAETPGLFATKVQSDGYGLGGYRNLCLVVFTERPQGLRTT